MIVISFGVGRSLTPYSVASHSLCLYSKNERVLVQTFCTFSTHLTNLNNASNDSGTGLLKEK
jgi:hypothetical protein